MKKILKENIRVEVYPYHYRLSKQTEESIIRDCGYIASSILRHVDDIDTAYVTWDMKTICEFCHLEWEESKDNSDPDFPIGMPLCCDKAIKEWEKSK